MAELLVSAQELEHLDSRYHWFCDSFETRSKHGKPALSGPHVKSPRQMVTDCYMLFAYDGDDTIHQKDFLVNGIDKWLGKCDVCIMEYYKSKRAFIDQLREEYDDDDIERLANLFHQLEADRIRRGLVEATRSLKSIPPERRGRDALSNTAMFAIIEALSCEKLLTDSIFVRNELIEPLALVQTNQILILAHYVPAMIEFLFYDNQALRQWAYTSMKRFGGKTHPGEFDFAFRGGLTRAMAKGFTYPTSIDPGFVAVLWRGLKAIVDNLDSELVTHSLRSLDLSIYRLALDQLQVASPGLQFIAQTLRSLLQTGPRDFWDDMGSISPSTVAEQIFRSPHYLRCLQDTSTDGTPGASSPHADMLNWITPFMNSLQVGQQVPACRTVMSQLMSSMQGQPLSAETKIACYKGGLGCLAYTLRACQQSAQNLEMIRHIMIIDALAVTSDYFNEILSILVLGSNNPKRVEMEDIVVETVRLALSLECLSLRIARNIIRPSKQKDSEKPPENYVMYEPRLWGYTEHSLRRGSIPLARAMIGAMNEAAIIERIKQKKKDQHLLSLTIIEVEFNSTLGRLFDRFSRILGKVGVFTTPDLRTMIRAPTVMTSMVCLLPSADQGVHESCVELIKAVTEESFRKDALRRFLEMSLSSTLNGMTCAASSITDSKCYSACSVLLKLSTDILDALCDTQDGLLRETSLSDPSDIQAIKDFWQHLWRALTMMYSSTEQWNSNGVDAHANLKEFVRDVMQLSETLFSQFAVFDNAVRVTASNAIKEDPDEYGVRAQDDKSTRQLLVYPSHAMEGVTKFLRLKDEYLLRTSCQLVRQLISALTKEGLELPKKTGDFLTEIAIYNDEKDAENELKRIGIKTLLSSPELAGIALDLEHNLGSSVVEEARKNALAVIALQNEKMRVIRHPGSSIAPAQKKRQGAIDFDSWNNRAGDYKDAEKFRSKDSEPKKTVKWDSSLKGKPAPGVLERKSIVKSLQNQKSPADQAAFLEGRRKAKEEALKLKAEQVAMRKKNIPNLVAGQTSGAGSALSKIGAIGKDRGAKGESMMVDSDSESDDSMSDDEFTNEVFEGASKARPSAAVLAYNDSKAGRKVLGPVKKAKVHRSAKDMRARLAPNMIPLYGRLLSWDFFHEGDFPPGSFRQDFSLVSDEFENVADYKSAFESLLLLEAWSGLSKAREEGGFRSFEVKISNRISVDQLFEASIALDFATSKGLGLMEADIILISKSARPTEDGSQPHCLGRISKIRHKKGISEVTIQVAQGNHVHSWLAQNTQLHAAKVESIVTLEREYGALAGLEWYDLCQEIIRAQVSPVLKYSDGILDKLSNVYKLNKAQAKAVQSSLDNDAFTLIQGPPGSGKTKTIVAIVGALLTNSIKANNAVPFSAPGQVLRTQAQGAAAPKKLLVCAPSNAAVDELVMRFMAGVKTTNGSFHKPNIVRLGRSDKVNPQVLEVTIDELVEKVMNPGGVKAGKEATELNKAIDAHKAVDKELKEMYAHFDEAPPGTKTSPETSAKFEQLKRNKQSWSNTIERLRDSGNTASRDADIKRRQAEQKVLSDAHIICATLSGSARETFQHLTIDFETVVIDEAAQCIELSALIPLKYGCSKCIMVGDPKQLPPTVLSREAARFQYEQSLFVRMQRNQPDDVHLLDTQYRMHPEISRFPSRAFYEGKLLDGGGLAKLRAQSWHADGLLGPYRFFDVTGRHETAPKGHSLINKSEIEVAMELYRRLKATDPGYNFIGKIGIITPYKSQLRLLSERFVNTFGQDITKTIEFNTTDAFQGRESEVIIFSCVRASNKGIGFLSDIRRMNVGITRAKSSLWVLGSSASLSQGEFWNALIQDAHIRNLHSTNAMALLKNTPRVQVKSLSAKELAATQLAANSAYPSWQENAPEVAMKGSPWSVALNTSGPSSSSSSRRPSRDTAESEVKKSASVTNGEIARTDAPHKENAYTVAPPQRINTEEPTAHLPAKHRSTELAQAPMSKATKGAQDLSAKLKHEAAKLKEETSSRESPPSSEIKRKRSLSPLQGGPAGPAGRNIRPPAPRKPKGDSAAFIIPRRKR